MLLRGQAKGGDQLLLAFRVPRAFLLFLLPRFPELFHHLPHRRIPRRVDENIQRFAHRPEVVALLRRQSKGSDQLLLAFRVPRAFLVFLPPRFPELFHRLPHRRIPRRVDENIQTFAHRPEVVALLPRQAQRGNQLLLPVRVRGLPLLFLPPRFPELFHHLLHRRIPRRVDENVQRLAKGFVAFFHYV